MEPVAKMTWYVPVFIVLIFSSGVWAQKPQSGPGNFDIGKVRSAAFENLDTMGGGASENSVIPQKSENILMVSLRIIFYLGIIIALILGIAWFVKKIGISGKTKINGGSMDVLEILPFGQNRNALLVRVMDVVYLLGQSPQSIVLIDKIEGQKAIDLIASSKEGGSIMQFKDAFNNFMGKIKKSS